MKILVSFLFLLSGYVSSAQTADTVKHQSATAPSKVSFVITIDTANAGKGNIYYINEYAVHVDHAFIQKNHGKKARVSGNVTIVKGLRTDIQKQGRIRESKHIRNAKIEILD